MAGRGKSRLETALVATGVAVLFAAVVYAMYVFGERNADRCIEETLGYACTDVPSTLRGNLYSTFSFVADMVASRLDAENPPSADEMRGFVDSCTIDELYLVGRYGRVVAASDPAVVGRDLSTVPSMVDFLSLVETPEKIIEQPIRLSLSDARTEVSYGGFPQPDGSLILCGYYVDHLRRNFIKSSADLMSTWEIGETGSYVVVDDDTGKLVFGVRNLARAGDDFTNCCPAAALACAFDPDLSHVGMFFGKLCHYRVFSCYGLRTVAFVEHEEFHHPVKVMVCMMALLLLLAILVFGAVIRRVIAANRAIARMREVEDRQRLKDMLMATSIQKHSLPTTFPPYPDRVDDFDIYAFMKTAKEVGGDFYDFYFIGHDRLALIVADVSGKGVPAAMFMMRAKTTLQGLLNGGADLVEAVSKANDRLCEGNTDDMFVTAWVGIFDLTTGEFEYVNAGHNPPIIHRADGSLEWVRARSGLVLAAMPGAIYRPHKLTLNPGDGIVLYTDGVTEAQNVSGELFGEDRLEKVTSSTDISSDAAKYCNGVIAALSAFVGAAEQADDITMLAFRPKRLCAI